MSIRSPERLLKPTGSPAAPEPREVVAIILECHGRIALLKRSQSVGYDRDRWHCVTGYLDPGTTPEQQARVELYEETGLGPDDISLLEKRDQLILRDATSNPWRVHTFKAVTSRRRLALNEEHVSYRWTHPAKVSRFSNRVDWLGHVLDTAL
ncbi:NUDIX domain-containing protein [Pseudarthrobacter oxydans]|uniref:NUDIX domain-containing protein n=1 Tax=Pseudarthrobacter oxydans TaxID=1671 RepID=UPI0037F17639